MRYKIGYIAAALLLLAVLMLGAAGIYGWEKKQAPAQALEPLACSHGGDTFCSHLPLVNIDMGGVPVERNNPSWAQITVVDNAGGKNHLGDDPATDCACTVWYRGNSSYLFGKKAYGLELYKARGDTRRLDLPLMGLGEDSDWVLNGPYLDKTLVRNVMMYSVAEQTMDWASQTRYCELFVDGEYKGVYVLIEPPKVSPHRLDLSDYALRSGETAYIIQRNRAKETERALNNFGQYAQKNAHPLFVEYPSLRHITKDEREYIQDDVSRFERALYADYFKDPAVGYKAYIHMDSFVTYYVLNEFSMNKDAGFLSTFSYKDLNEKLHMGPVWDFNNAFDNYQGSPSSTEEFYICNNNWFERLLQDRAFVDAVCEKYRQLRQDVLSDEYLFGFIDDQLEHLGPAAERNFDLWAASFDEVLLGKDENGQSRDIGSHREAVERLKSCITRRGEFLDGNIELLYYFCKD